VSNHKPFISTHIPNRRPDAEKLVGECFHVVTEVARSFRNRLPASVDLDDLVGDGSVGLIEAAQRFNPRKGASFKTFAKYRIRGAIADGLRRVDRVSRHLRQQQRAAERAIATLRTLLGRSPTEEEIAVRLGLSLANWQRQRRDLHAAGCQLPGEATPDTAPTLPENLPGVFADPEEAAAFAQLSTRLGAALQDLPPRHRAVVCLYYVRRWTMREIGTCLGVTEGRVCQIHTRALAELRMRLSSSGFRCAA
jgi:RNA polymerase sigma factor for flagellar operon FliA